jgi:hypothetical protein
MCHIDYEVNMKQVLNKVMSYFPTPLPLGMTAYKEWTDSVAELIGPITNKEELNFCIASEVIRLAPDVCSAPKNHFVKRVRAGVAKQIAGAMFTEIKENQKAKQAAEAAKQAAEVTAATSEAVTQSVEAK